MREEANFRGKSVSISKLYTFLKCEKEAFITPGGGEVELADWELDKGQEWEMGWDMLFTSICLSVSLLSSRDVVSLEHGSYNFQSRKAVKSVAAIVNDLKV